MKRESYLGIGKVMSERITEENYAHELIPLGNVDGEMGLVELHKEDGAWTVVIEVPFAGDDEKGARDLYEDITGHIAQTDEEIDEATRDLIRKAKDAEAKGEPFSFLI